MNRRQFLHTTTATLIASQAAPLFALDADNAYRKNIGIQLYTLRNELAMDTPGTIKAVVDAGYKQGEMFNFPDCQPVIAAAKDSGLELHSSHFQWDSVTDPTKEGAKPFESIVERAKDVGLSHLVVPYLADKERVTLDDYKRIAENCNKAAAVAKKAGIQLSYHNHSFEFEKKEGGKTGFEIFVAEFSEEMQFEIDVFWIRAGGHDPVEMLKKLKGRVSQVHLKDLKDGLTLPMYGGLPNDAFQELGDGIIPMEPIIKAAGEVGVKICHVEQDQSPDPIASIKQSMAYLKAL
ncbi:MAG: sugar phosphate isomerase/epimerase [Verrucomicrobiae bacterium]|nr:sugar phosphate isomerase/epimerase [Verrucomicrobiae bacterium]